MPILEALFCHLDNPLLKGLDLGFLDLQILGEFSPGGAESCKLLLRSLGGGTYFNRVSSSI